MTLFGINICAILLIQNATHISLNHSKSKDALMFAVTQGEKKACQMCESTHLSDFHLFRVKKKNKQLIQQGLSKLLRKIPFKKVAQHSRIMTTIKCLTMNSNGYSLYYSVKKPKKMEWC